MQSIESKYAKVLVEYSLGIKEGDKFLIQGTKLAEPLMKEVYRHALRAGAHPELKVSLPGLEKIFYDEANDTQLEYISPVTRYMVENYDARIYIDSPANLKELTGVDPDRKRKCQQSRAEINKIFMKRAASKQLRWSLCVWPTEAAAQECEMSLEEYQQFVFNACRLYEDNPVAQWNQFRDWQQKIVDHLNKTSTIKYQSPDLDITFSCKDRTWINSAGNNNMPSGEVFTGPVENSVNGHVRFSYPGIFMGQAIEDIRLEVKDGQVVKWDAAKGAELLDKIFEIPGARYFGECAVGTNKMIDKFTKNMLFDEKIGGTIHMAVGASYPETGGKNDSSVHWDMLADMSDGGKIYADDELIYENGEFIIGK